MNITRGPVQTAKKIGIFGPEGVGKTTFASNFPGAVFIDTEGSTKHMDVARFDTPVELMDVVNDLNYVLANPKQFGTVVIDTVDWLEKLIFQSVCSEKKIQNIEDIGYGKGYVYAKQKFQQILEILDMIVAQGVHVVLVCHSTIRKFEQPDEMGSYDRYMLKLNEKNIAPLVKEWVDMLLFCNYKTDIVTAADGKTKKARGGQKRIMYANHSACWDAKNRFGLPDEMPMEYDQIAHLFGEAAPVEAQTVDEPKPEPVEIKRDAPATVEKVATLPTAQAKKSAKKKDDRQDVRPDYLHSDNPEKDALLDQLWKLMCRDGVYDPTVIQAVVAEKEYYDLTTPIRDYDKDFIEGCLIEAWKTVCGLALTKQEDLPF
jgi:hypothetical protein